MASTSSKVWLTLAAAVGTLVIAGVVVSAPSVQRCQGQEEGLWACLRGELITFGLLPDETPEPPVVVVGQPVPDDLATPAADASSPPPAAESPAPAIAPELSPPAEPAVVEPVPAAPPATDEVAPPVAVAELPQEPPVATPEPAPATVSDALPATPDPAAPAAAITPDALPDAPDTAMPPVATAEAVPEPSAPPQDEPAPPLPLPTLQPQAVADGATGIAATATVTSAPTLAQLSAILAPVVGVRVALLAESLRLLPPASTLTPPELPAPATAAPDLTQPVAAPGTSPSPAVEPPSPAVPVEAAPALPVATSPPPAPAADPPATEPIVAAPAEPALPPPPTLTATATAAAAPGASATITPTIDAIEIDGSSRFIAGAGTDGSTVDLYVGQRYIGSAEVDGGRWLVEARGAITDDLRVVLAPQAQGRASLGTGAALAFNVAPTGVRLMGKQAAAELLQVQPESELELTPAAPALQAFVTVDPEMLRFRSGKAIIRRGDTLWAIARRVYGRGALYPVIFEANRELVRSPGRIFPGQVLTLPQAD